MSWLAQQAQSFGFSKLCGFSVRRFAALSFLYTGRKQSILRSYIISKLTGRRAGSHGIAFNAVGSSVVICKKPRHKPGSVAGSHGIAFNAVGSSVVIRKKPTAQTRCRGYQLVI
ncbi:MAG: hypothetical protein M1423_06950, partial [Acidobacteria bacterium]|nr:hypothetical protein [Acidobacteriota bacterium]